MTAMAAMAAGCTVAAPPARSLEPPPLVGPTNEAAYNAVSANADAARVLAALRNRRLALVPSDVSRADLLAGSPGYAWRVGSEWLHLHTFANAAAAEAAARRAVEGGNNRRMIIDWVGKPHLFRCRTAVALYLGEYSPALDVLTRQCGAPAQL